MIDPIYTTAYNLHTLIRIKGTQSSLPNSAKSDITAGVKQDKAGF